jgi:hypothetical protein
MTTSSIFSNKVSQTQTDDDLTPSFNVTVIENMAQTDVLQMSKHK